MTCTSPHNVYQDPETSEMLFHMKSNPETEKYFINLPCGSCMSCRLSKSRTWAIRLAHESKMHDSNYVLTLTYSDENLPNDESLNPKHIKLFIKRLRKQQHPRKIRYYIAGEYGDKTFRPHYHACIFNINYKDLVLYSKNIDPDRCLYTSQQLEKTWGHGQCMVGVLHFDSAMYCAKYITKKQGTPEEGGVHQCYIRYLEGNTQPIYVKPEFSRMSLRPGIGATFYKKYERDLYANDYAMMKGIKWPIPKYYDKLHDRNKPLEMEKIKESRVKKAADLQDHHNYDRQNARRIIVQQKVNHKKGLI